MLPERVSNPWPLTYESGALSIALRGPAPQESINCFDKFVDMPFNSWCYILMLCPKIVLPHNYGLSRLLINKLSEPIYQKCRLCAYRAHHVVRRVMLENVSMEHECPREVFLFPILYNKCEEYFFSLLLIHSRKIGLAIPVRVVGSGDGDG